MAQTEKLKCPVCKKELRKVNNARNEYEVLWSCDKCFELYTKIELENKNRTIKEEKT